MLTGKEMRAHVTSAAPCQARIFWEWGVQFGRGFAYTQHGTRGATGGPGVLCRRGRCQEDARKATLGWSPQEGARATAFGALRQEGARATALGAPRQEGARKAPWAPCQEGRLGTYFKVQL